MGGESAERNRYSPTSTSRISASARRATGHAIMQTDRAREQRDK